MAAGAVGRRMCARACVLACVLMCVRARTDMCVYVCAHASMTREAGSKSASAELGAGGARE